MKKRLAIVLIILSMLMLMFSACTPKESSEQTGSETTKESSEQTGSETTKESTSETTKPAEIKEFIVAVPADLRGFNSMPLSDGASNQILYHVYEQLTMIDYASKLNPQLASSWKTNSDNTEWTLTLKEGVTFHDGSEFDSEDVVASLTRYQRVGNRAATFEGAKFEAVDKFTVKVTLPTGNPLLMEVFGAEGLGGIVMIPAEYCAEEYDENFSIKEAIGTGPYKFVSYEPNTEVVMEKFTDYVPDKGENNGYGGEKIANFDKLIWKIVPDPSQRLNGLLAGEYQYAAELDTSAYATLEASEGIEIMTIPGIWIPWTKFNTINGLMTDIRMRQALMLCLDMDECMLAAVGGNEDLYELNHSLFFKNQTWYSDVGSEWYDQDDDERAKQLLKDAGYNGEELIWIVTQDYAWMYDIAVVVQQQAADVGINIKLEVHDWATAVSYMRNGQREKEFDLWTTGFSYPDVVDPSVIDSLFLVDNEMWPQESQAMEDAVNKGHSSDMNVRIEAYNELVKLWYEEMYGIIYGNFSSIAGYSSDVDVVQQYVNLRFFNCDYK